jgi:hypothetical protein
VYFWKIEEIKSKIIKSEFNDEIISALLLELQQFVPVSEITLIDYIFSITSVIITIIGTLYIYDANGGAKGKDFAVKFFAMGFVMAIRFVVLIIPIALVFGVVEGVVSEFWLPYDSSQENPITSFLWLTLFVAAYLGFYMRWAKHVRDTVVA